MIDKDKAIKLAGKLAIAANFVITANAKTLSQRILEMEECLNEYDNYIFNDLKDSNEKD